MSNHRSMSFRSAWYDFFSTFLIVAILCVAALIGNTYLKETTNTVATIPNSVLDIKLSECAENYECACSGKMLTEKPGGCATGSAEIEYQDYRFYFKNWEMRCPTVYREAGVLVDTQRKLTTSDAMNFDTMCDKIFYN